MKKLIPLLLLLTSCSATYRQQRDVKKLDALAVQQQPEFKRLANLLDPCFTGVAKSDTVISTHTDTLVKDGVTTIVKVKDTVYVTKTLPSKIITNTRTLSIHDTVTNDRAIVYWEDQTKIKADSLLILKTQLSSTKHGKNIWMFIAIGLALLVIIDVVWTVYKFINPVAKLL